MGADNPSWGQRRFANELWLKLGLKVSPRTVRKYLPNRSQSPAGARNAWFLVTTTVTAVSGQILSSLFTA